MASLRSLRRSLRRKARRALGGAIYGVTIAGWSLWSVVYCPFAVAFSTVAFVLTAVAAGVIALVAGE